MMNAQPLSVEPAGLAIGDIYYVVFRHKWKILACAALAAAAAYAVFRFAPPPYQSEAKLFVRYVLSEKALGPAAADAAAKSPDQRGETIMNSEAEILTSVDLARQVAEAIGPEKILAKLGGGKDVNSALAVIKSNLTVTVAPNSSVIHVVFRHPDAAIVQPVLQEVVAKYLKLHVETHTANGMLGDFLTQETDQLRSRLAQTEEELRKATAKAGVITVDDAKKSYAEQIASIRKDLFATEAELAQRTTALQEINKRLPSTPKADTTNEPIPLEVLSEYRSVSIQLELLRRMEQELLTQFTSQNPRVVEVHSQIETVDQRRQAIQQRYPRLLQIGLVADHSPGSDTVAATSLETQITALKAKIDVLNAQITSLRGEISKVEQMEGTIVELRRKRELEESNYRYYAESLEQARVNETLGNGHVSNIVEIQSPAPPFRDRTKTNKAIAMILAVGMIGGFGWAFALEFYFDRSIKRAVDVERTLDVPLLLSIPQLRKRQLLLTAGGGTNGSNGNGGSNGHGPAPDGGTLMAYHDTLRDRIIAYFESVGLNHKPKLVAITGLGNNAGVTTTAAGLARSLSETGEGNVLLVDMTAGEGVAHQFTKGRPVCGLDDILQGRDGAHIEQNLYVVTETSAREQLSRHIPQRFTRLVPKLKASDFDYIIFDMPAVNQISITPRLAGFMDLVLLVIESERTDRDLVQRATQLLSETRAHVGVVLNKTRQYVPRRLHQESLAF